MGINLPAAPQPWRRQAIAHQVKAVSNRSLFLNERRKDDDEVSGFVPGTVSSDETLGDEHEDENEDEHEHEHEHEDENINSYPCNLSRRSASAKEGNSRNPRSRVHRRLPVNRTAPIPFRG